MGLAPIEEKGCDRGEDLSTIRVDQGAAQTVVLAFESGM